MIRILIISFLLYSCGAKTDSQESVEIGSGDTSAIPASNHELKNDPKNDSLRMELARKDAFKISETAFQNEDFNRTYEFYPGDSSYTINVEIVIGHLFSDKQRHFLLRRHAPWVTYINLYQIEGDKTKEVLNEEQGSITYLRDTIADVNGDGFKDFLVHSYPASGCCRRDVYEVFLNQSNRGEFTEAYEFINPTFSPEEKVIRGVGYGHPGEVELYKYKWNGLQVDTLEFIYPHEGHFIKTKRRTYKPSAKEGVVLKEIPTEYRQIESYEWFADF